MRCQFSKVVTLTGGEREEDHDYSRHAVLKTDNGKQSLKHNHSVLSMMNIYRSSSLCNTYMPRMRDAVSPTQMVHAFITSKNHRVLLFSSPPIVFGG